MALTKNIRERPKLWLRENRAALPSMVALVAVLVFWTLGALGGIDYLHNATSPTAILAGLYIMLAAVAVSIIVAALALNDLATRFSRARTPR